MISYSLDGTNIENLFLRGSDNLNASGNAGANRLSGNDGRNVMNGLGGADTLIGGKGDDTYYVDDELDVVVERANEGVDTVISSLSAYALLASFENLTLAAGTANLDGTGNALANVLIGNDGNNILDGGDGDDSLIGGAGNDYLIGGNGDDTIDGGAGDDLLYGGPGDNTYLFGFGDGQDRLDTWAGGLDRIVLKARVTADDITFSRQAETGFLLLSLSDGSQLTIWRGNGLTNPSLSGLTISLFDGTVLFFPGVGSQALSPPAQNVGTRDNDRLSATVETPHLFGIGGDDVLDGSFQSYDKERKDLGGATLEGGAGNDTLIGADIDVHEDTLMGGLGDDVYYVNNSWDMIVEKSGEGYDTVFSSVNFTLQNKPNIEELVLTGSTAIYAQGNAGDNTLVANDIGDRLDGGLGADRMIGGKGDDIFYVENIGDLVIEKTDGGNDTVVSWLHDYTLADHVENLALFETGVNGRGNRLDNVITGDGLDNYLFGDAGDDQLYGAGGNDSLYGGVGNDTINGGVGADTAIFQTTRANATILHNADGSLTVASSLDGTDTISNVEYLQFADQLVRLAPNGDFNGDTRSDVLLNNVKDGACFLWQLQGTALLNHGAVGWSPGASWQAKTTGDFNGDGKGDILLQNAIDGSCYAWELNGAGFLIEDGYDFVGWTPGTAWQVKATADFNGDGKSDILLQNIVDGSCFVWEMNGLSFAGSKSYGFVGWTPGAAWQVKATGDFNGDGMSDILLQNAYDGSCYVWEMNGLGFAGSNSYGYVGWTPGAAWQVKATGDFNGDGKSDILLRNALDGSCYVWEMNGLGFAGGKSSGYVGWNPGTAWQVASTGDFNGDGKSDIVLQNVNDGSCFVWEMNGLNFADSNSFGYVGWTPGAEWHAVA